MKENTQKILMWLYPVAAVTSTAGVGIKTDTGHHLGWPQVGYAQLAHLWPQLTAGGRRSLVAYLDRQQWLERYQVSRHTYLSLTQHGRQQLEATFPVFSPTMRAWDGQWSSLVFLTSPASDPHFRYLRSVLIEAKAMGLSRGVYLYPGEFPPAIQQLCREMYVEKVVIFKLANWQFGDEKITADQKYGLTALIQTYSGISKEIDQLLTKVEKQNRLTSKQIKLIFSVFDRLFSVLPQDPGLIGYYFPRVEGGLNLLLRLQQLLNSARN